jgi:hypothetical protein
VGRELGRFLPGHSSTTRDEGVLRCDVDTVAGQPLLDHIEKLEVQQCHTRGGTGDVVLQPRRAAGEQVVQHGQARLKVLPVGERADHCVLAPGVGLELHRSGVFQQVELRVVADGTELVGVIQHRVPVLVAQHEGRHGSGQRHLQEPRDHGDLHEDLGPRLADAEKLECGVHRLDPQG